MRGRKRSLPSTDAERIHQLQLDFGSAAATERHIHISPKRQKAILEKKGKSTTSAERRSINETYRHERDHGMFNLTLKMRVLHRQRVGRAYQYRKQTIHRSSGYFDLADLEYFGQRFLDEYAEGKHIQNVRGYDFTVEKHLGMTVQKKYHK